MEEDDERREEKWINIKKAIQEAMEDVFRKKTKRGDEKNVQRMAED